MVDYAGRQQNGLLRDYYLPRWQMLIDATLTELNGGKPVNRNALETQWSEHNFRFATTVGGNYFIRPQGDFFMMSRDLFEKYSMLATNNTGRVIAIGR